jgi:hypothetical protein
MKYENVIALLDFKKLNEPLAQVLILRKAMDVRFREMDLALGVYIGYSRKKLVIDKTPLTQQDADRYMQAIMQPHPKLPSKRVSKKNPNSGSEIIRETTCGCGCGGKVYIRKRHLYTKIPQFLRGHAKRKFPAKQKPDRE